VFSASANGVLVFDRGEDIGELLTWLDLKGNVVKTVGEAGTFYTPSISPDGTRFAVTRDDSGGKDDVWVYDSERGAATRVTSGPEASRDAIWMPDGRRLVYRTRTADALDLFVISAEGVGKPKLLLANENDKQACSVSGDGKWLLYSMSTAESRVDLYVLPLDGETPGEPVPYVTGRYDESGGRFAPNGRWIAYESNESGRMEIYVASFPVPDVVRRVSTDGGQSPRWAPDGSRLVYSTVEGEVYASRVRFGADGLSIDTPEQMFDLFHPVYEDYDVTADRLLLAERVSQGVENPLTLVLNWAE
jgi:Tol biopolymer transport system component